MNERHQTDLLARWLASGARGEPPAGLDPDTVASVYALRPDLAPAPRLTVDDILDGITSGPFAAPEADAEPGGEVVPFPVPASRPTVLPPKSKRAAEATRRSDRTRWIGGGLGLLAAAAAALLTLSPSLAPGPNMAKTADRSEADATAPQDAGSGAPAAPPIAEIASGQAAPDAAAPAVVGNAAQGGIADGLIGGADAPPGASRELANDRSVSGLAASGYAVAPAEAAPAADAVAQLDDGDAAQTGAAGGWGGASNTATAVADEKEEARAAPKMAARAAAAPPPMAQAESLAAPKPSADAAPAFDANAVIAAASKVAANDPLSGARQLEPFIRQGTAADGQRIALAAARYARDAGDLDKAESLARAGLARGGAGPDSARLTSLISAIAQTRAADQAAPSTTGAGN